MAISRWLSWFESLLTGFAKAGQWLINPIQIGDLSLTPLGLISFTGLSAFIVVAIIKWVVS